MKKYRCECECNKCEVSSIDEVFIPVNCLMFNTTNSKWKEVEEIKETDEILNLPSWCKVGELVYYTNGKLYCKIHEIDKKRGIIIFNSEYLITDFVSISELAEARLRPFNENELRNIVGRVIEYKDDGNLELITGLVKKDNELTGKEEVNILMGILRYDCDYLLQDFKFADGSPCGVYEHLENGEWVK